MTIRDDDVAGTEPASGQGPVEPEAADPPEWDAAEWYGRMLVDVDGKNLGKLQDVYVDVETDEPQFGTIKEGFFDRHLTFLPLVGIHVGPDYLQVQATADQVKSAPDIERHGEALSPEAESALYHHFQLNYFAPDTAGGVVSSDGDGAGGRSGRIPLWAFRHCRIDRASSTVDVETGRHPTNGSGGSDDHDVGLLEG